MKVEKRGNTFRVRKTVEGKTYSLSFDTRPTKADVDRKLREQLKGGKNGRRTFQEAAEEYLDIKSEVLSPSTIVNYRRIINALDYVFLKMYLDRIDSKEVQWVINEYSKDHSPKSVRNLGGFISTVMKMFCPETKLFLHYPQSIKYQKIVPTEEMVKTIIEDAEGSDYYIVYRLAIYGLRKSEIIAVTSDKVNGELLTIDQAKVVTEDGTYKEKTTKTVASTRTIRIDTKTAELIKTKGCAYDGFPGNILRDLHRRQKKFAFPPFNLHSFRAYYASFCHANGIPDAYIMKTGGWANQSTLDNIYRKTLTDQENTFEKNLVQKLTKNL